MEEKEMDNRIQEEKTIDSSGSGDEEQRKAQKILESLSGIDSELVERSSKEINVLAGKRLMFRKTLAAAAILAVVVLGGLGISNVRFNRDDGYSGNMKSENMAVMQADRTEGLTENLEEMLFVVGNEEDGVGSEEAAPDAQNLLTGETNGILQGVEDLGRGLTEAEAEAKAEADDEQEAAKEKAKAANETPYEAVGSQESASLDTVSTETQNWGLSFGESGTQPGGVVSPEELKTYNAYYVGSPDEKVIYLTFDCGYENGYAPQILDTLKKHHVKVTFFVVGTYIKNNTDIVKRMVEEGHNVGNHSYSHPDMSKILTEEGFRGEMEGVSDLFEELIGGRMTMFYRPPQGKFNRANLELANRLGYYTIFWSLAHVDWLVDEQPDPAQAIENLNSRIHPGAVVLLHIVSKTNAEMLDELLTDWEEMGYRFGTLNELCGVE